jgi:fructokinase
MDQFSARAEIVKLSDTDFAYLYGGNDYSGKAKALFATGTHLFVVTRGVRGAHAWHARLGQIVVEAPRVDVVDTIGAGDSFQAGLLFALRAIGRIEAAALADISARELTRALPLPLPARPSRVVAPAPIRRDIRNRNGTALGQAARSKSGARFR